MIAGNDIYAELRKRTETRAKLLILNPLFGAEVKRIRAAYDIPRAGFVDAPLIGFPRSWKKEVLDTRWQTWDEEITNLMKRANLLSGWRKYIEFYLVTGTMDSPPVLEIMFDTDKFGNHEISIRVNDVSSLKDLNETHKLLKTWRVFEEYQRETQKLQPIRFLEQYIEIYNLHLKGLLDEEIAQKINNDDIDSKLPPLTKKLVHDQITFIKKHIDVQFS